MFLTSKTWITINQKQHKMSASYKKDTYAMKCGAPPGTKATIKKPYPDKIQKPKFTLRDKIRF